MNILDADSMKPHKLKRHLLTVHAECVCKSIEYFKRKLNGLNLQKHTFPKIIASEALLTSFKVSYRIANCGKSHLVGESFVLSVAVDMVKKRLVNQALKSCMLFHLQITLLYGKNNFRYISRPM
jgi:hypothetical protein